MPRLCSELRKCEPENAVISSWTFLPSVWLGVRLQSYSLCQDQAKWSFLSESSLGRSQVSYFRASFFGPRGCKAVSKCVCPDLLSHVGNLSSLAFHGALSPWPEKPLRAVSYTLVASAPSGFGLTMEWQTCLSLGVFGMSNQMET